MDKNSSITDNKFSECRKSVNNNSILYNMNVCIDNNFNIFIKKEVINNCLISILNNNKLLKKNKLIENKDYINNMYIKSNDSNSLWNHAISPGWTSEEIEILKIALTKFGIGKWKLIKSSGCLPGKTISQMNIQTQKLLGQQSLAEFMGLKIDLEKVYYENKKQLMSNKLFLKKGFIINTGNNLSNEEKNKKRIENKKKYYLSNRLLNKIKVPHLLNSVIGRHMSLKQILNPMNNLTHLEKINEIINLIDCLKRKINLIEQLDK